MEGYSHTFDLFFAADFSSTFQAVLLAGVIYQAFITDSCKSALAIGSFSTAKEHRKSYIGWALVWIGDGNSPRVVDDIPLATDFIFCRDSD